MTYSRVAFRPRQGVSLLTQAQAGERLERSVRVRVGIAWGLLFFNTLTFFPHTSFIPIPGTVGKAIAQAALPAALLVALSVNPKAIVRPNVLLCLVSLLVVGSVLPMLQPQSFGIVYRTLRMAGFVAGLWLLTPWWGRRDLLLVRCYFVSLWVALGSVLLGLFISPHQARANGRLDGCGLADPAHPGGALRGGSDRSGYRALVLRLHTRAHHSYPRRRGRSHSASHAHQDRAGRLDREPAGSRTELGRS